MLNYCPASRPTRRLQFRPLLFLADFVFRTDHSRVNSEAVFIFSHAQDNTRARTMSGNKATIQWRPIFIHTLALTGI